MQFHRAPSKQALVLLIVALLLAACNFNQTPPEITATFAVETPSAGLTPTAGATSTPGPTPTPSPITLRLWVLPQFAPGDTSAAAQLLQNHLTAFRDAHPDIMLDVRVKRISGMGGMLESLEAALLAAPGVAPDIVLLEQNTLATAAREQIVFPLDNLISTDTLARSYAFAYNQALFDGALYGLPLVGEAQIMVYNTTFFNTPPQSWEVLQAASVPITLAAASQQPLAVLQLYLGAGGRLTDDNGRLLPDADILAEVLRHFQTLNRAGSLYIGTQNYTSASESWQAYRENRAVVALTDTTNYLRERNLVFNTRAAAIPSLGDDPTTLVRAYYLAIVTGSPQRQQAALNLQSWLTEPTFLAEWSLALGYLPLQRDAVDNVVSMPNLEFTAPLLESAQLQPTSAIINRIGPPLATALGDVLRGRSTPEEAANTAIATLNSGN